MSEETTALQVEAPEIDAEPQQQMDESGAHKALKAERERAKRLERELREVKSQLSPEAARQMEERIKAAEEAAKRAEDDANTKAKNLQSKYERDLQAKAQELEKAKAEFTQFQLRMEGMKIFQAAEGLDGVSGDGRSFFDFLWSAKGAEFAYDSDGKLMIVDGDGQPLMDKESGTRVNPVDYVKGLQTDPVYGHLFKPAFGSGSGGRSVTGGRMIPGQDIHSLPKSEKFRVAFGTGK
jgi:dsDNA-specific endonuclease/ATPase MutS2